MKKYSTPEMKLLVVDAEDIISTSVQDYTKGSDTPLEDVTYGGADNNHDYNYNTGAYN